jgi:hypothetical protein
MAPALGRCHGARPPTVSAAARFRRGGARDGSRGAGGDEMTARRAGQRGRAMPARSNAPERTRYDCSAAASGS